METIVRRPKSDNVENSRSLADYIIRTLKASGWMFHSWGPRGFTLIDNGVMFRVDGLLLKGTVAVVYNEGWDLFDIEFAKAGKGDPEIVGGICFDDLADVIDGRVERGRRTAEQYKKAVITHYEREMERERARAEGKTEAQMFNN